jgi:hypothetical protein
MKNGVWVGSLIVALSGYVPALFGQDGTWRPATSLQPVSPSVLNSLQPCPAVTLGRPVVISTRPVPEVSAALKPASFNEAAVDTRASAGNSGWTDDSDKGDATEKADKSSEFGIDRPAIVPATAAPASIGVLHLIGLTGTATDVPKELLPTATTSAGLDAPVLPCAIEEEIQKPRWYLSGEYLLWWLRPDKAPPLASTSSNPFDNGELGRATTLVLFGGDIDGSARSGFRVTAGWWLDETCRDDAVELRGFYLGTRSTDFDANSSQYPVIARPFFNINMQQEFAQLTAFPGVATGNLAISEESHLWGAEANARCRICSGCDYRLEVFGGFRYLELEEWLNIVETGLNAPNAPPPFPGDRFVVQDFFLTRNQFYGGQLGVIGDYYYGPFSVEGRAQVALGDTVQSILIDGDQIFTDPNGTTHFFRGGLLALSSNSGRYTQNRFSVVPELSLNIGYQVNDHVRLFVGYDFLYWTNVVRPGGQIDRNIDITLIPNFPVPGAVPTGLRQPAAPQPSSDFWAQGMTVGVEFRY